MARRKTEFEIKLAGAPADVAALLSAPVLRALEAKPAGAGRLVSTYFDDREGSLAAAGYSLRLRESAGARIQTLKAERALGIVARFEEERRLKPGESFPVAPEDAAAAKALASAGPLSPVTRTDVVRRRVNLRAGRTIIEAAVDIGRAELLDGDACLRAAPLAEVELELVDGRPRDVFKAARLIAEAAEGRVHPSSASKADRARLLARGGRMPAEREMKPGGAEAGDVLEAALAATALRLMDLIPSVLDYRAAEGVHQTRVALRRIRSVLRAYRPAARSKILKRLQRGAGAFADALGPAREWDVFLAETLRPIEAHEEGDEGLARLRARGEGLCAAAWDAAAATIASPAFTIFVLDLLEAAHCARWRGKTEAAMGEDARVFAVRALDARLVAVDALAQDFETASPEQRHEMRIALKRLRYTAQAFAPLFSRKRRKGYIRSLSRLQDDLGAINDAHVAETLAALAARGQGRKATRAAGVVFGYHTALAAAQAEAVAEDWRAFRAKTPFWRKANKETHAEDTDHSLP